MGLPLYFGLPSDILPVALFVLQMQQSTINNFEFLRLIKIGKSQQGINPIVLIYNLCGNAIHVAHNLETEFVIFVIEPFAPIV